MTSVFDLYGYGSPQYGGDSIDASTADVAALYDQQQRYGNSLFGRIDNFLRSKQSQPNQLAADASLWDQAVEAGNRLAHMPVDMLLAGSRTANNWAGSPQFPERVEPGDMLAPLGIGAMAGLGGALKGAALQGRMMPDTIPASYFDDIMPAAGAGRAATDLTVPQNRLARAANDGDDGPLRGNYPSPGNLPLRPSAASSVSLTEAYERYAEKAFQRGLQPDSFERFREAVLDAGIVPQRLAGRSVLPGVELFADQSRASLPGLLAGAVDRNIDGLGYYSQLDRVLSALGPKDRLTLDTLRKRGVKDAELEARGVLDLAKSGATVSDIKATAGDSLRLSETKYGEPRRDVKWSRYSLDPSNPTYRETVLHLPAFGDEAIRARMEQMREEGVGSGGPHTWAAFEAVQNQLGKSGEWNNFNSGHFPEPNIVGHLMTSMVEHEGKPTYLVDQIQSDWGQKLRDGGVRDEAKIAELKAKVTAAKEASDSWYKRLEAATGWTPRARENAADAARRAGGSILTEMEPTSAAYRLAEAELRTAEAATPGHPLVNTTDQWTNTTLRRALRQAAEEDADYIAIPSGKTVLSYNPGDEHGMAGFYDQIVPKNLGNILKKLDPNTQRKYVNALETPSNGMAGDGFSLFGLSPEVRETIKREGLPLFADQSRASLPGLVVGAVDEPRGITAYHGSPHDFDRFDMSKIGTGEGAQAYGHGLYFAENESVARRYKDELGGGGSKIVADSPISGELRAWLDKYPDVDVARMMLEMRRDKPGVSELIDEINRLSGARAVPSDGHLYEVRINADPEDFLDWDKPLSQQSEKVRRAVASALPQDVKSAAAAKQHQRDIDIRLSALSSGIDPDGFKPLSSWRRQQLQAEVDGLEAIAPTFNADLYRLRGDQALRDIGVVDSPYVANALREAGIPGIRYLDQGSRTAGEGSRNYVLFRDDIIEIVKKYGIAAAASIYGMSNVQDAMASEGP